MPDSYSAGDVRPGGALPPVEPGPLRVSRGIFEDNDFLLGLLDRSISEGIGDYIFVTWASRVGSKTTFDQYIINLFLGQVVGGISAEIKITLAFTDSISEGTIAPIVGLDSVILQIKGNDSIIYLNSFNASGASIRDEFKNSREGWCIYSLFLNISDPTAVIFRLWRNGIIIFDNNNPRKENSGHSILLPSPVTDGLYPFLFSYVIGSAPRSYEYSPFWMWHGNELPTEEDITSTVFARKFIAYDLNQHYYVNIPDTALKPKYLHTDQNDFTFNSVTGLNLLLETNKPITNIPYDRLVVGLSKDTYESFAADKKPTFYPTVINSSGSYAYNFYFTVLAERIKREERYCFVCFCYVPDSKAISTQPYFLYNFFPTPEMPVALVEKSINSDRNNITLKVYSSEPDNTMQVFRADRQAQTTPDEINFMSIFAISKIDTGNFIVADCHKNIFHIEDIRVVNDGSESFTDKFLGRTSYDRGEPRPIFSVTGQQARYFFDRETIDSHPEIPWNTPSEILKRCSILKDGQYTPIWDDFMGSRALGFPATSYWRADMQLSPYLTSSYYPALGLRDLLIKRFGTPPPAYPPVSQPPSDVQTTSRGTSLYVLREENAR